MFDEVSALDFEKMLYKLLDKRYKKKRSPDMWTGVVTAYNGVTKKATIYLAGDEVLNTSEYPNLTNQTLVANDIVYLISSTGELTNAFVAFKTNVQQV